MEPFEDELDGRGEVSRAGVAGELLDIRDDHGGDPVHYICIFPEDCDLDHVWTTLQGTLGLTANAIREKGGDAIHDVEPWFGFEKFDDSNITFWVFIQATDRLSSFALTNDLVKVIHRSLGDAGVDINYPMRKLVMPQDGGQVAVVPPIPPTPVA